MNGDTQKFAKFAIRAMVIFSLSINRFAVKYSSSSPRRIYHVVLFQLCRSVLKTRVSAHNDRHKSGVVALTEHEELLNFCATSLILEVKKNYFQ